YCVTCVVSLDSGRPQSYDSEWLFGRAYSYMFFFFNDTATTEIYTLSLHDALPICELSAEAKLSRLTAWVLAAERAARPFELRVPDRKSTRLNSSHVAISYAVFCLKKKKKN